MPSKDCLPSIKVTFSKVLHYIFSFPNAIEFMNMIHHF